MIEGWTLVCILALMGTDRFLSYGLRLEPDLLAMAAFFAVLWLTRLRYARRGIASPLSFAYAAAILQGVAVEWFALMDPAHRPTLVAIALLFLVGLHWLRLWPPLVAFAGIFYAGEIILLGVRPSIGRGGLAVPPGPELLHSVLLLVAAALLWHLARTARALVQGALLASHLRETTLAELARSLEQRVDERTRELRQAVARQATLAERERIARELHDGIAKSVVGLAFELRVLEGRVETLCPAISADVRRLAGFAQSLAVQARDSVAGIRASIGLGGLQDLLRSDAYAFSARTGIRVDVSAAEPLPPLPPELVQELRQIVSEGLENTARHGAAMSAQLSVAFEQGDLVLRLQDDGRGAPDSALWQPFPETGHFGLQGIRERSARHGGIVRLQGHGPLGGFGLEVRVPVPRPAPLQPAL